MPSHWSFGQRGPHVCTSHRPVGEGTAGPQMGPLVTRGLGGAHSGVPVGGVHSGPGHGGLGAPPSARRRHRQGQSLVSVYEYVSQSQLPASVCQVSASVCQVPASVSCSSLCVMCQSRCHVPASMSSASLCVKCQPLCQDNVKCSLISLICLQCSTFGSYLFAHVNGLCGRVLRTTPRR